MTALFCVLLAAAPSYETEVVRELQRYIRIDTTNPPGNELVAAQFFADFFRGFGVEGEIIPIAPGRANFYARVRGDGGKKALLLTNHMDVVSADPALWRQPPFSGALVDGEIWGRGALDMKTTAITDAFAVKMLVESGATLSRDVIFLALADEEDGSLGAAWIVEKRPELLAGAELALNEGATIEVDDAGRVKHYAVATMEKSVLWLELAATGEPGHGSTPTDASAVHRLTRALGRLLAQPTPIVVTPAVASYFAAIAPRAEPRLRKKLADLGRHAGDKPLMAELTRDPFQNALLRNTVAVNALHAGDKVNVIPARATALVDCRLLPGTDKAAFMKWLRGALGDDGVTITETLYFGTMASPADSELMRVIRELAAENDPGAPVIPMPLTGTTDSSFFRRLGIITYGFEPVRLTHELLLTQHGNNERISVENVRFALRFKYELVRRLAAR